MPAAPRERRRFATFVQVMRRTKTTAPSSTRSAALDPEANDSRNGAISTPWEGSAPGLDASIPAAIARIPARAASIETDSRRRATIEKVWTERPPK